MIRESPMTVKKVIGADFELSNALIGSATMPAYKVARCLLKTIEGCRSCGAGKSSIEMGRRFLPTCGSSWYIDSDHLEGNLPEHASAWDHPAVLHGAGFAQAQAAMHAAVAQFPVGTRINLLANCSDGRTAWGSHLNILVTRCCFENLLYRKLHFAALLATHLVTSVIYTGQGKVGASNGRSACSYQLSQRADWFEQLYGQQTMVRRPLINLRDESHAESSLARLHLIYYDMCLSPVANILKVGTTQLLLAMFEAGWSDATMMLDDPVNAASQISRDLGLRQQLATVIRGRPMTAIEIQQALAEWAAEFVRSGAAVSVVPGADSIVALWLDTLELLRRRDVEALARRSDAWLKYLLLEGQRGRRNLSWSSSEMHVADSLFASLDPDVSLFYQAVRNGFVERMPDERTIRRYALEPPDETRAYFRAHLLRCHQEAVSYIDWSRIQFRIPGAGRWWLAGGVDMPDPRRLSRVETEGLFQSSLSLQQLVEAVQDLTQESSHRGDAENRLTEPAPSSESTAPTR